MSVPYIAFECTGCALTGTNAVTWGIFAYGHEDGLTVNRTTGFCADCDDIVAVEVMTRELPPRPDADPAEAEEERRVASLPRWKRPLVPVFRFLLGEGTPRSRRLAREALARHRAREREAFALSLARGPVCLHCGGPRITRLQKPAEFKDNGRLYRTGFQHPGCGGEFLVRGSNGERIGVALETRVYDLATGRQISGPGRPSPLTVAFSPRERGATWSP